MKNETMNLKVCVFGGEYMGRLTGKKGEGDGVSPKDACLTINMSNPARRAVGLGCGALVSSAVVFKAAVSSSVG